MEKDKIFVTLDGTFKDEGKCRVAMERIVNDAHAAYGVNSHFWFRSNDGKSLFVLEQYENNKALSQAIRRFTTARISFFRSIEVIGISIYGSISRGNMVAMNAKVRDEEKCKEAMQGVVEGAYAESGTKTHFWCKGKEGNTLFVLEQYADEKALIEHLMANPTSRAAFFESIEVIDVSVYGTVSDQIKEMLAPLNPRYMNYYGGYSK